MDVTDGRDYRRVKGDGTIRMETAERIKRWRLILGAESEDRFSQMQGDGGGLALSKEELLMDQALAAIYNKGSDGGFGGFGRGAGHGPSHPQITRWLGDVRTLFEQDMVKIIQSDAVERCGLKQLLLEPEMLEQMEPDVGMASTILMLKDQIPKASKESVREFIRKIVEELNRLLADDIRRAVTAAINRRQHSPIPSASALDFANTIKNGLKNYHPQTKKIIPDHYYFFDRTTTSAANKYTIILDVDQSGSMGESVIYSSVISCILASMASLKTRVVAFDTKVVDLTEQCEDPVDLIFGFQLGGGTDINQSVAYCQQFIENPQKTLFFLVSDLEEGGNRAAFLRRMEEMKASGVQVVSLLAIADGGKPYYDTHMAGRLSALGIPCFACNPQMLPELLKRTLKGEDLGQFQRELEKGNGHA